MSLDTKTVFLRSAPDKKSTARNEPHKTLVKMSSSTSTAGHKKYKVIAMLGAGTPKVAGTLR